MSGLDLLRRYSNGATQDVLAERFGLSQGYVALLLAGKRIPGTRGAVAIERASGGAVPASAWLQDIEQRRAKRKPHRRGGRRAM